MSLINQMLRDLDARRAPAADRMPLRDAVHAMPQNRKANRSALLAMLLFAAAAIGGAWYWFAGRGQPAPAPAIQVAPAPQPQAAAVPPAPAAVAAAPAPEATPPAAPAKATAAAAGTARVAAPRSAPPAVAAAKPDAKPRATARAAADKPVTAPLEAVVPAVASAAMAGSGTKVAAPAGGEPSIEKRPHTPLANEAAENEYNKAITALRRGATSEAIVALQSALRLDVLHVSARQALLSLLLRQQQWGDAQGVAEEGLAVDPTQTGWAMALARLQMENGKLAEATEILARHARYADRNADYQAFHALLLQKQKRYREAGERYAAAVALRPGEARWWYGLGVSLDADQRPQEAHEAFLKAREAGNLPPELMGSLKQYLR